MPRLSLVRLALAVVAAIPYLLVMAGKAFAAEAPPPAGEDPFMKLLLLAFSISIAVIGFFLQRHLKQNDENNRRQWRRLDDHETRLSSVEGVCRTNHPHWRVER